MFDVSAIPLSLYIHTPWCVKKCPYCDFNSHEVKNELPEQAYFDKLIQELSTYQKLISERGINSIFIGGGTPSLISDQQYLRLFQQISALTDLSKSEITIEANPATVEQRYIDGYRDIGINRISLGAQSFNPLQLKKLGRIHSSSDISSAFKKARNAGFDNINIDLMHSLPEQTLAQALDDLKQAILLQPEHLSWYQLTLEPNTLFYAKPPKLPNEHTQSEIETHGLALLEKKDYRRYEVSAFSKDKPCQHNKNYWRFGDYIGIGAGAHGKITNEHGVTRTFNQRHPKQYLNNPLSEIQSTKNVHQDDIAFEYMLNALRLFEPVAFTHFETVTGLEYLSIESQLTHLAQQGLITCNENGFELTKQGTLFLNNVTLAFLT